MDTLRPRYQKLGAGKAAPGQGQQGFVLVLALVILIIMTLSSVAMVSSLRGGISASANIAFRQAATRSADVAVDGAFQWIQTQMNTADTALNSNIAAANTAAATATPRYYATMNDADSGCLKSGAAFTPQTYRFSDSINGSDGFPCAGRIANSPSGYTLYYVIHRMANTSETACLLSGGAAGCGSCPTAGCLAPQVSASSSQINCSMNPDDPNPCGTSSSSNNRQVYYRITVKVVGPRQNNRYIQGFVY